MSRAGFEPATTALKVRSRYVRRTLGASRSSFYELEFALGCTESLVFGARHGARQSVRADLHILDSRPRCLLVPSKPRYSVTMVSEMSHRFLLLKNSEGHPGTKDSPLSSKTGDDEREGSRFGVSDCHTGIARRFKAFCVVV